MLEDAPQMCWGPSARSPDKEGQGRRKMTHLLLGWTSLDAELIHPAAAAAAHSFTDIRNSVSRLP